ncbi:hypothetical protein [Oryzifoliimicrobium ureilyticus]|uniref:hypothetical protein n=1 Tax=Oryzifoliimicrobium ureilyticus TaxID=3113724 RepID=UPI0030763643
MNSVTNVRSYEQLTEVVALERARSVSIELKKGARKARVTKPITSGGAGFRARKSDKIYRGVLLASFMSLFLIPSICMAGYYFLLASDQYVTETRFAIKSGEGSALDNIAAAGALLGNSGSRDGQIVAEFIKSSAMLDALEKKFNLRQMFSATNFDVVSRLDPLSSRERLLSYWKKHVDVNVDRNSGLVTLDIRAFSPSDSLQIAKFVLGTSEQMVNDLTRRAEKDAYDNAQTALAVAQEKLESAVSKLRDARNTAGILDVNNTSEVYTKLITDLRLKLANLQAQAASVSQTTASNAPQLVQMNARITEIKSQIENYESMIAGDTDSSKNLAGESSVLSEKELEKSIAQSNYISAVTDLEKSRINLERQRAYLQIYVPPTLPQESLYPRRFLVVGLFSLIAFVLWGGVAGLATLVRDNMAS